MANRSRTPRTTSIACMAVLAAALGLPHAGFAAAPEGGDLTELSLEELMGTEVTSVSRKGEPRSEAADAIYVITHDEIERSGVRTLADALRLAPGMQVARVDANRWAVGVRGFASSLARSVLVLVDGRTVYNPLFAGTYWEVQDYPLDDVDRIEIIRGPGGTLWGANAFNGVINIITRSARQTQGGLLRAGAGSEERAFGTVRYGGRAGDKVYYRGYAKGFDRDAGFNPGGRDYDAWRMGRTGFRTDWDAGPRDAMTVQGDFFAGSLGERVPIAIFQPPFRRVLREDGDISGGDVLARWTRVFSERSHVSLQAYWDNFYRRDPHFLERRNTGDLDFQHRYRLAWWQEIIWGLGYRVSADHTAGVPGIRFDPADRTTDLFSAFVQDEFTLVRNRLRLTVGSKIERNDFTGVELQPSGRLLWTPDARHTVWGAVSRAVRTPSRVEDDFIATGPTTPGVPAFVRVLGNPDFVSEKVLDYQVGYRVRPLPRLFVDVVPFYNAFDDLLSLEPLPAFTERRPGVPHLVVPLLIDNKLHGESYGVEIAVDASLTDWWRLNAAYSYLDIALRPDRDSGDVGTRATEGNSPHNVATVRSMMNLPSRFQLDLIGRYVDTLPNLAIDSYVELDVRIARRFGRTLELAVVGQNLLADHHREFSGGTEVERGAYGMVRWWW
jgi:iron complex outermembrane recepter protein